MLESIYFVAMNGQLCHQEHHVVFLSVYQNLIRERVCELRFKASNATQQEYKSVSINRDRGCNKSVIEVVQIAPHVNHDADRLFLTTILNPLMQNAYWICRDPNRGHLCAALLVYLSSNQTH